MTELKTLKDLSTMVEGFFKKSDWVNRIELRQEAIKWIKEFKEYLSPGWTESVIRITTKEDIGQFNYSFGMRCGAILVLKQIFNITEEDI